MGSASRRNLCPLGVESEERGGGAVNDEEGPTGDRGLEFARTPVVCLFVKRRGEGDLSPLGMSPFPPVAMTSKVATATEMP